MAIQYVGVRVWDPTRKHGIKGTIFVSQKAATFLKLIHKYKSFMDAG